MSDDLYMSDPRAKTFEGFCAGLMILAKHSKDGMSRKFGMGAEHDIITVYVSLDDLPADSEDGLALIALGFHTEEDSGNWGYFT